MLFFRFEVASHNPKVYLNNSPKKLRHKIITQFQLPPTNSKFDQNHNIVIGHPPQIQHPISEILKSPKTPPIEKMGEKPPKKETILLATLYTLLTMSHGSTYGFFKFLIAIRRNAPSGGMHSTVSSSILTFRSSSLLAV